MKVLSKNLLTVVTAIALFMLPILFAGCNAQANDAYKEYIYQSANTFFSNRENASVENFANTTYKFSFVDNDEMERELEYKESVADENKVKKTFINTAEVVGEATVAILKDQTGFKARMHGKRTTTTVEHYVDDSDLHQKITDVLVEEQTFYFYPETVNNETKYYLVWEASMQENNEAAEVTKQYREFGNVNLFTNAINDVISRMNEMVEDTFFEWSQVAILFGDLISIDVNGGSLTATNEMGGVNVYNRDAYIYNTDTTIKFNENAPYKATQVEEGEAKGQNWKYEAEIEVVQSATITLPESREGFTQTTYINYTSFFHDLPEIEISAFFH